MVQNFNFDLRPDPNLKDPPHPGYTAQELRQDPRNPNDIMIEFLGKSKSEKLSHIEFENLIQTFSTIILARI